MKMSCLAYPNEPRICAKRGKKAMLTTPPLPSASKDFLNPNLQGMYFEKGTLNNDRPPRESLHQLPARKLNIKCNADLAVDIHVEKPSLPQSEMINNVPMPERKIRTTSRVL